MTTLLAITAQALVEHCIGKSASEVTAACDAALSFLRQQGWTTMQLRALLPAVRRELRTGKKIMPALLVTPSGNAGTETGKILETLERTLDAKVELMQAADGNLLGGATLAVGDERLDASVRGELQQLQYHLTI